MRKARAVAFVGQNPNLFGSNVMIFESYAELDTTLNHIQEMDHKALRAWATENNVQNDILESNIIYNEEWDKAWEVYNATPQDIQIGLQSFPGITRPAESIADKVLDSFF